MSFWWTDPLDHSISGHFCVPKVSLWWNGSDPLKRCSETLSGCPVSAQHCQKNSKMTGGMHWTSHWDLTAQQDLRGFSFNVMPNCLSAVNPTFAGSTRTCSTLQFDTHTLVSFFHFLFVLVVCRQRDVSFLNYLCIFHTVTNVHYTNVFYELTLHVNHQHLFSSS